MSIRQQAHVHFREGATTFQNHLRVAAVTRTKTPAAVYHVELPSLQVDQWLKHRFARSIYMLLQLRPAQPSCGSRHRSIATACLRVAAAAADVHMCTAAVRLVALSGLMHRNCCTASTEARHGSRRRRSWLPCVMSASSSCLQSELPMLAPPAGRLTISRCKRRLTTDPLQLPMLRLRSTRLLLALQLYVRWSNRCDAMLQVEDIWVVQPRCDVSGDEAMKVHPPCNPSKLIAIALILRRHTLLLPRTRLVCRRCHAGRTRSPG